MRKIGRYAAAAAVLLAAPALAGCTGDDPQPKISPSPTASSPASPSPTSTSATPEAETPEAFIRRWAELETEMQNTGDTSAYRAVTRGCDACGRAADLVDQYYAAGGFIEFGGHSLSAIERVESAGGAVFTVRDRTEPTKYKESADAPTKTFEGGVNRLQFTLRKVGPSWNVVELVQLA